MTHEPVGAMKVGEHLLTWSFETTMNEVTPRACKGALGTWQFQEYPDIVGPANNETPVEANQRLKGWM